MERHSKVSHVLNLTAYLERSRSREGKKKTTKRFDESQNTFKLKMETVAVQIQKMLCTGRL